MSPAPRVLIVDESPENGEVLRALVERTGAEVVLTRRPLEALALAEQSPPDLIVVDADSDSSADRASSRELRQAAGRMDTPIVFLGAWGGKKTPLEAGQVVSKPYHYGPLVRKIEDLLAARRGRPLAA